MLNGPRLRRIVRTLRPDVVNAHYATGYGTLARAVKDVPVVLNVWGSDVYGFPEKSPMHRWLLRRNLLAAHRLVSTSEAMADRTCALVSGLPRPTVVPFGVDTTQFRPREGDGGRAGIVIGTVKTLSRTYGIDTLIEAFALLVQRPGTEHVRLRIVGGGPDADELARLVARLGIVSRVEFIGPVAHARVPEELRELDVYCALSREESFGVAVIEASACGLPVVVSDAGGLPEVVKDGVTGSVVPRGDPAAAAEAIARLVASTELRQQWGRAGRAHVRDRYEWSHCVERMLNVLADAARKDQPHRL
jgi:glycosyltransferase involved in cell wall biosynthesis